MRVKLISKISAVCLAVLACVLLFGAGKVALAASPTTVNFQGKVVNSDGTNVTNGTYSFVFRIYNTATPTSATACSSDATCLFEETQSSVTVTNGTFQVELGSTCSGGLVAANTCTKSVTNGLDFSNNATLYLTLQFNGDTSGTHGGFMWPVIHLTSVPYAYYADTANNANQLGGISSFGYLQLGPGSSQNDYSSTASIFIDKSSPTGDIMLLQSNGLNALEVNNAGATLLGQAGASGLNGTLTFNNSAGPNTVSLSLQADPGTSYTLLLPTTGPSTSQCLQTDSSVANQLKFASCSGGSSTLASSYNSTGTSGNTITLASAGGPVVVQDNSSALTGSLFTVMGNSCAASTCKYLDVSSGGITVTSAATIQGGSSPTATVGSEQVASQDFTNATYWTCTGWTLTTTTAQHNTGNTTACSATSSNFTVTTATLYQVSFQLAGNTTGTNTVTVSMGGINSPAIGQTGTNTQTLVFYTSGTNALTFTPTTNFNGTISSVSLKPITAAQTPLVINSQGTSGGLEVRTNNIASGANIFIGLGSGRADTTGRSSIGLGTSSLMNLTTGLFNTATGYESMATTTTGGANTATGYESLYNNVTGGDNTALGAHALVKNTSGGNNTAVGVSALDMNATGTNNTAVGYGAGSIDPGDGAFSTLGDLQNATMVGYGAIAQASNVLILGGAGSTISNLTPNIGIGTASPDNIFSISPDIYDTGVASVTSGAAVVTGSGTLWSTTGGQKPAAGMDFIFADGTKYTIQSVNSDTGITLTSNATVTESGSAYRIHSPNFYVSSTGNAQVRTSTNSASAFQIQNAAGSTVLGVATSSTEANNYVGLGFASNINGRLLFNNSAGANTITLQAQAVNPASSFALSLPTALPAASNYCIVSTNLGVLSFLPCGASSTATVTLSPEFVGAVMSGVGGTNTGTMTSDYCAGSSRFPSGLNTSVCTVATDEHNYYSWTANAGNSYDIFVRWSVPQDFASFSSGSFNYWKTAAGDTVTMNVYPGSSTACATQSASGTTAAWGAQSITMTGCTPSAGGVLTIDIHLAAGTNSDFARIGEITLGYNRH